MKYKKIRELLGNEYHLSVEMIDFEHDKWVLFKKYDDSKVYFSKDNEPIMTSETHTYKQLYEFAKNHHKIDEHLVMNMVGIIFLLIAFILSAINIFLHSSTIRIIIWTTEIIIITENIISHNIWKKNWKVRMITLKENFKRNNEKLYKGK